MEEDYMNDAIDFLIGQKNEALDERDRLIEGRTEARAEAFQAQEEARSAWSQLSYVAEALGVAPYGGCYSPNDVLSAAKTAQERVRELTEILRHAYAWMAPDGCDCGTDEPGSCALCETERILEIATKRREGK